MISHDHKTVFVHVPKCAGQSVETAFLADVGLTWETRAPLLLRPNDRRELGPPRLAHLIAADYTRCHYLSKELFDSYYRFAIIRDPWSRAVSLYRHLDLNMPFRVFVEDWLTQQFQRRDWEGNFWFVRPQADFVMSEGRLLVDDLVRFEKLSEEFGAAARKSHLRSPLPHANRTIDREYRKPRSLTKRLKAATQKDRRDRHGRWQEFYDGALAETVGKIYAADVDAFGYGPPETGSAP